MCSIYFFCATCPFRSFVNSKISFIFALARYSSFSGTSFCFLLGLEPYCFGIVKIDFDRKHCAHFLCLFQSGNEQCEINIISYFRMSGIYGSYRFLNIPFILFSFFNVIYEILNELALVFFDAVLFMQNVHFIHLRRAQSGQLFWLPISLESVMLHSIHACLIVPFFLHSTRIQNIFDTHLTVGINCKYLISIDSVKINFTRYIFYQCNNIWQPAISISAASHFPIVIHIDTKN